MAYFEGSGPGFEPILGVLGINFGKFRFNLWFLGLFWGFWVWIRPYLAYFQGSGPGFGSTSILGVLVYFWLGDLDLGPICAYSEGSRPRFQMRLGPKIPISKRVRSQLEMQ